MSVPLRSIPPLIPLPQASSPTAIPHNPAEPMSPRSAAEQEDDIDRFATLFSPATPRASPVLAPIFPENVPTEPITAGQPVPKHHSKTPSSASSEFGSFVSVPSNQDPLSLEHFSLESAYPSFSPIIENPPPTSRSPSHPHPPSQPNPSPRTENYSLSFFDKFAEDAKRASEQNKRGVLDELLLHEDDPLYWLKPESSFGQTSNGFAHSNDDEKVLDATLSSGKLVDLDPETAASEERQSRHPQRRTNVTTSTVLFRDPLEPPPRSPSVPLPSSPRLAVPPETSPTRSSHIQRSHSSSFSTSSSPQRPQSTNSSSYSTFGTLSSRFMSSLLSSSRPAPASTSPDSHRTLDTLFTPTSKASAPLRTHSQISNNALHAPSIPSSGSSATHPDPHALPQPHHAQILSSFLPSSTSTSSTISHGTPFASHPFIPPTGAPGFAGDHQWDKGFSADFDKEKVERRSVRLGGRKESTSAVLSIELADLIRPHLPALSRLPRAWTLLYSLDQHGISLNTLYTRCEAHTQGAGMLVVVRDSGDGVFGAWMGEGIRLERGGYYGSGESFLWKLVDQKLRVFRWTGKNDYVALCEPGYISFGGGEGHYGLYLDDTLFDGSSARCPTFENEPLCTGGPRKGGTVTFECVGLEVWGVGR